MSRADGPDATRLFEIFFDLVRLDSESGHEGKVCSYIEDFCSAAGFAVHEDDAARATGGECGNLVVRVPAGSFSPLPPVILCAHMDTVRPGNHVLPFDLGDRFVSMSETVLGADCKAGIASMLGAVEWLGDTGGGYRALELIFTVQEERGLNGVKHLDTSLVDGVWGVVLDGSGPVGGVVVEAPCRDNLTLTFKGKAAHAGVEPELGVNAIHCAARGIAGAEPGRLDETTTLNIGTIRGGVADNIVPEEAVVEAEVRSMSAERLDSVVESLIAGCRQACEAGGCELAVERARSFEHFKLDAASPPVYYLAKSLKDCGFEPRLASSGGGSDANFLNASQVPCVVMNIGLINAHTKEEQIMKDELHGVARTLARLAHLSAEESRKSS